MSSPKPQRRYLVAGVIVLAIAGWLLLPALGVALPPLARSWPVFILLGGLASVADFFVGSRAPGSLGRGVFGMGLGLLCFGFSTGRWGFFEDFFLWFPALPLIIGAGFLATWLADGRRRHKQLIAGVVGVGLGITGFAHRFDWLHRLIPSPAVFWGLLLLVLGAVLLWQNFRPRS
jgi:hypothetical protein